jgi:hypothetical protein
MAWAGGTFTRIDGPTGWQDDAGAGIPIQASLHDTAFNDLATDGINQCINKTGQNTPTANLPMGGFKHTNCADGSASTDYATFGQVQAGVSTQKASLSVTNTTYSADATGVNVRYRKSRGAAPTTNTIVQNGDEIAYIAFAGADGSTFQDAAAIQVAVDGVPGATNDMPGRISFLTKADNSASMLERMRIDKDGQVALGGPAAARAQLHVLGSGQTTAALADTGNRGGTLRLIDANGSAGNGGAVTFGTSQADTANSVGFAAIKGLLSNATSNTIGDLAFATRNATGDAGLTERMRIRNDGQVLVNETTANIAQFVATTTGASFSAANIRSSVAGDSAQPTLVVSKTANDSTTSNVFIRFAINTHGTGSGQITANGANQAAFGSFSDARLKENITELPSQFAALMALRPVEFDYLDGSGHQVGFIAQEVQPVYPDLVGQTPDGFFTISGMGKNEARLVKGFQELAQQVIDLTARVEALEAANP